MLLRLVLAIVLIRHLVLILLRLLPGLLILVHILLLHHFSLWMLVLSLGLLSWCNSNKSHKLRNSLHISSLMSTLLSLLISLLIPFLLIRNTVITQATAKQAIKAIFAALINTTGSFIASNNDNANYPNHKASNKKNFS